jgi:hypothetical protein
VVERAVRVAHQLLQTDRPGEPRPAGDLEREPHAVEHGVGDVRLAGERRRRFNEIGRGNPGLSRTLLSKRPRQLERAGVIDHVGDQYLLTPVGDDLRPIIDALAEWGARYQFGDPREHQLDPELLMWWVHDRLDLSDVSGARLVLEFHFQDRRERIWILHDREGPSVCTHDPGFGIDATIATDLDTMYRVWLGSLDLRAALRSGAVEAHGRTDIVRRLPDVLELSPVAPVVAAHAGASAAAHLRGGRGRRRVSSA